MITEKRIARITSTFLGVEDHGIFTASLTVDYGGAGQGVGNYFLDDLNPEQGGKRVGTATGMEFIMRILRACGVKTWEEVKGRTILVLFADNDHYQPVGIENLPTEPGEQFLFADVMGQPQ